MKTPMPPSKQNQSLDSPRVVGAAKKEKDSLLEAPTQLEAASVSGQAERFTNRKPFAVTADRIKAFKRGRERWNCSLCGHEFQEGDTARWIYANFTESPVRSGNFFVCPSCDGTDADVLRRAAESFKTAVALAKQWGIYGPEWL